MAEIFYVGAPGQTSNEFTSAKEAGAAFYHADENQQPYVIHEHDRRARVMASTEIHGQRADKTNIYVKSLPGGSHSVDADFVAGFRDAQNKAVALVLADKVMSKTLEHAPDHVRAELQARVEAAVERGGLKLPDARVLERSATRLAVSPTIDRSR